MPVQAKKITILIGDIIILYLSLFLTVYFRYSHILSQNYNLDIFWDHVLAFTPLILLWLVVFYIHSLYEITSAKNTLEFYTNLSRALVINFFISVFFFYFASLEIAPKTNLFIYFGIFSLFFIIWRGQTNYFLKRNFLVETLIVSSDEAGAKLALKLNQNPQIGYKVVLLMGSQLSTKAPPEFWPETVSLTKGRVNLADLIKQKKIKAAIIDDDFLKQNSLVISISDFIDNIEITSLNRFNERVWRKVDLKNVNQLWLINNLASGRRIFYEKTKRFLDLAASVVFLPVAAVLGFFIAIIIKLEDRGPVFYRQIRVGERDKLFVLNKFRTMIVNAEPAGAQWTVANDKRTTRIGRFLRKTRLDELPQLINIITGEMSFVGPRAERPEFHQLLVKEIPFYNRRYLIKPGLTGWAQINYTYGSSVEDTKEKLSYDFYYLKNRSLIFDFGVILKTINIMLSGLGR